MIDRDIRGLFVWLNVVCRGDPFVYAGLLARPLREGLSREPWLLLQPVAGLGVCRCCRWYQSELTLQFGDARTEFHDQCVLCRDDRFRRRRELGGTGAAGSRQIQIR